MGTTRVYVGGLNPRVREDDLTRFVKGFGSVREIILKNGFSFIEFDDHRDASDAAHDLNGRELLGTKVSVELARGLPRGRDRFHEYNAKYGLAHNDRGYGPPRGRNDYGGGGRYDRFRGGGGGGFYDRRDDRRGYRGGSGGGGGGGYGSRPPLPSRTPHRLVVQNLTSGISWQDLKDFMRQAGEVMFADVFNRKNEGVVEFASLQDMRNALDRLDGREFMGRKVKLTEERKRDGGGRRASSPRRSRRSSSRSGSSSRSRTRSRSRNRRHSESSRESRSASAPRNSKTKSRSRSPSEKADAENDKRSKSPEEQRESEEAAGNEEEKNDAEMDDKQSSPN